MWHVWDLSSQPHGNHAPFSGSRVLNSGPPGKTPLSISEKTCYLVQFSHPELQDHLSVHFSLVGTHQALSSLTMVKPNPIVLFFSMMLGHMPFKLMDLYEVRFFCICKMRKCWNKLGNDYTSKASFKIVYII